MKCEQELCPTWTGDGCVCQVVGIDRESEGWASYAAEQERNSAIRSVAEGIARAHAAAVDAEFGCCHDEAAFLAGGRAPEFEGDQFEPIPNHCPGKGVLDRHLAAIQSAGRRGGMHSCVGCGLELDSDDPNDRCEECIDA